jgi:mRNA-degrading endonuclease toxin of MazEF toxin-antitoxin module
MPFTTKGRELETLVRVTCDSIVEASWAIVDQIRAIDKSRLRRRVGAADESTFASVEHVLRIVLGM